MSKGLFYYPSYSICHPIRRLHTMTFPLCAFVTLVEPCGSWCQVDKMFLILLDVRFARSLRNLFSIPFISPPDISSLLPVYTPTQNSYLNSKTYDRNSTVHRNIFNLISVQIELKFIAINTSVRILTDLLQTCNI